MPSCTFTTGLGVVSLIFSLFFCIVFPILLHNFLFLQGVLNGVVLAKAVAIVWKYHRWLTDDEFKLIDLVNLQSYELVGIWQTYSKLPNSIKFLSIWYNSKAKPSTYTGLGGAVKYIPGRIITLAIWLATCNR